MNHLVYNDEGRRGVATASSEFAMNVTTPGRSVRSIACGAMAGGGAQEKWCSSLASINCTMLSPSCAPGQTRLPAPNGSRRKSWPLMSMSSSMNRSGRNLSGSFQMEASLPMAYTLQCTMAPLGTSYPPSFTFSVALWGSMSGVGGCNLNASFATACKYGNLLKSASVTTLSRPTTCHCNTEIPRHIDQDGIDSHDSHSGEIN